MSRENLFALYGYIGAFYEMGHLIGEQAEKLVAMLGLKDEELEGILL